MVIPVPKYVTAVTSEEEQNSYTALSPMPGLVDKIFVDKGDAVKKGDSLLVIVAMKMEVSYLTSTLAIQLSMRYVSNIFPIAAYYKSIYRWNC